MTAMVPFLTMFWDRSAGIVRWFRCLPLLGLLGSTHLTYGTERRDETEDEPSPRLFCCSDCGGMRRTYMPRELSRGDGMRTGSSRVSSAMRRRH